MYENRGWGPDTAVHIVCTMALPAAHLSAQLGLHRCKTHSSPSQVIHTSRRLPPFARVMRCCAATHAERSQHGSCLCARAEAAPPILSMAARTPHSPQSVSAILVRPLKCPGKPPKSTQIRHSAHSVEPCCCPRASSLVTTRLPGLMQKAAVASPPSLFLADVYCSPTRRVRESKENRGG